jgi:hypothetical protein
VARQTFVILIKISLNAKFYDGNIDLGGGDFIIINRINLRLRGKLNGDFF